MNLINIVGEQRRAGLLACGPGTFTYFRTEFRLIDVPDRWVYADTDRMAAWFVHYGAGGRSVPTPRIQQIVWPDKFGRFPDDPDCEPVVRRSQPILRDHPMSYPKRAGLPPRSARGRRPRRR
jgi:hypothetical protein